MFSAASLARTGSYSMVMSWPPVCRRPRPIQMALYPLAAPISSTRLALVEATSTRRNRPSSSDTASWPLSAARMLCEEPLDGRRQIVCRPRRDDASADQQQQTYRIACLDPSPRLGLTHLRGLARQPSPARRRRASATQSGMPVPR